MADYQLTSTDIVIRTEDQAYIPNDPTNGDRMAYDKWLTDGNTPDPYVPPPADTTPAPQTQVLYDHENRLRSIEGTPPLTLGDFVQQRGL